MNACAARENIQLWATHVVAHGFDMACMLCHLVPVRNPSLIRPSHVAISAVVVKVEVLRRAKAALYAVKPPKNILFRFRESSTITLNWRTLLRRAAKRDSH